MEPEGSSVLQQEPAIGICFEPVHSPSHLGNLFPPFTFYYFLAGAKRDFFHLRNWVQTNSGAHQASYPTGTGGYTSTPSIRLYDMVLS